MLRAGGINVNPSAQRRGARHARDDVGVRDRRGDGACAEHTLAGAVRAAGPLPDGRRARLGRALGRAARGVAHLVFAVQRGDRRRVRRPRKLGAFRQFVRGEWR